MPLINKKETITTKNGEITINLNLKIEVEGYIKSIECNPEIHENKNDKNDIIPDELFSDIILVNNFGKKEE